MLPYPVEWQIWTRILVFPIHMSGCRVPLLRGANGIYRLAQIHEPKCKEEVWDWRRFGMSS